MNERLRIAIIDDNRDAAESLGDRFGSATEVKLFLSCEELLATGESFDAVVTDTSLGRGNMNGFECAQEIHRINPDSIIIGTSGMAPAWAGEKQKSENEYRTMYQRMGADDFFNRADGAQTIAARVLKLLNDT